MRIQLRVVGKTAPIYAFKKLKQRQIEALANYIGQFASFEDAAQELNMPLETLYEVCHHRHVSKDIWKIFNTKVFKTK
jgi:hypothetical protein